MTHRRRPPIRRKTSKPSSFARATSISVAATRISTLLGSCVSITLWHRAKRIGGMCHYMMPSAIVETAAPLDGRYAGRSLALS